MVLWHIEYVWLSAVWWKRLDVSDGHAERNLLNDSIPPEKLQEGFIFVYLIRGPPQTFVGRRWMGKAVAQIYKASENKIKVIHAALCNTGASLHVWHVWLCLMFQTRAEEGLHFSLAVFCLPLHLTLPLQPALHQTKDSLVLFSCARTPPRRCYSNRQSETM